MTNNKTIFAADLFCGAGGTSSGLRDACNDLGLKLHLTAINHWDVAIATHSANHPDAEHLCESLDGVDPRKVIRGGKLRLLVASPECFPAGTLILTDRGLLPIEHVAVGTRVLTHTGRWMPVTATQRTTKDTVIVHGHGHYGLETTAEHPFLASQRKQRHRPVDGSRFRYTAPEWVPAGQLVGRFWGTPTVVPEQRIPALAGASLTPAFWWLVGRWLGDGSVDVRPGRGGGVSIACSDDEADELLPCLRDGLPLTEWRKRRTRTAVLFECRSRALADWLVEHFGKLAHGKTVPAWALGMPREWRAALLDGYMSADGYFDGRKHEAATVSRALAIGVRLLAEGLGYRAALHRSARYGTQIEGRKVSERDIYRVMWVAYRKRNYAEEHGGVAWSRVRSLTPGRQAVEVFNLSVAEDESYVADGIIVHNCTHHSRARGGKPMSDQSRASAWHVLRWCEALQVQDVLVENVIEFREWGPLGANRLPLKRRKGETYQAFLNALRSLGYTVEDRVLCAADYGDPTSRKRLFIRARKGNRKITWPEPTHSPRGEATLFGKLPAYRAAREIIDWDDKGRSIFNRKRPLSPNTLKRILAGLRKFGGLPFVLPHEGVHRGNAPRSVDDPVNTITAGRGAGHLVEPFLAMLAQRGENDARSVDRPVPTVTAQGQHTPALTTSTSAGASVGLAQPFILGQQSGGAPRSANDPLPTITTDGAIAVVEPFILAVRGGDDGYTRGASVDEPLPAITTPLRGAQAASPAVVEPFIVPVNHGKDDLRAYSMDKPLPTITSVDAWGLAEPYLIEYYSERDGQEPRVRSVDQPLQTVTAQNRIALVQPFLVKYYGTSQGASSVNEPLDTVMARDRFALVLPVGDGHVLVDIRFRMLKPDELARAHSFHDYEFHGTREQVVRQIGNSVPVQLAKALCASALI